MYEVYDRTKEIREAILAGEIALDHLKEAKDQLDSASTWGMFDLFGGNIFTGMMKHSRIDDASRCVERAKKELARFRDELEDIQDVEDLHIEIDSLLVFADYLFDGLFADMVVQSKISDYRRQVEAAMDRVQDILFVLQNQLTASK